MPTPPRPSTLLAELRATPRSVVVRETILVVLVLAAGMIPVVLGGPHPAGAVAGAVGGVALLLARSRWPLTTMLGTVALYSLPSLAPVLCTSVIAFTAGRRSRPLWRFWLVVTATVVLGLATSLLVEQRAELTTTVLVVGAASTVFLVGIPALAGVLLGGRRPMVRLLRERNEYLERSRALTGAQARAEERTRIAGEMHDLLGHRLSLISMHAGALELAAGKDAPRLSGQAELLRTTAGTALAELRQILGILRVSGSAGGDLPDGLGPHTGTHADLAALVDQSRRAGVEVEFAWAGDDLAEADPRTRYAVHRAVREGLTNVHRHAPATPALVEVSRRDDRVRATVTNGPGTAPRRTPPGTRRGLAGLDERTALLGGSFAAGPSRGGGFQLVVDLPVHPGGLLPEGDLPAPGAEPPVVLDAEVLTLPRLLGTGCLALLLAIPFAVALAGLVISAAVR